MGAAQWNSPVIGVLGGMGPAATVAFLDQLVRFTAADCDQDHIDVIVTQHGSIPPRSDFILHPDRADDPTPVLLADAQKLQAAGADMLVMPCNTASYFWPAILAGIDIPGVSIVAITAERAAEVARGGGVAILATAGTIEAGMYQRAITQAGGRPVVPSPGLQDALTRLIARVKAGDEAQLAALELCIGDALQDADVVVLGCTELSVLYDRCNLSSRPEIVDSLRTLVLYTIAAAGRLVRR